MSRALLVGPILLYIAYLFSFAEEKPTELNYDKKKWCSIKL